MAVRVRSESDLLAPEIDHEASSAGRPWLSMLPSLDPGQRQVRPPLHIAPWDVDTADESPKSASYTDATLAFAAATASWGRAILLFSRTARAFKAAHGRHAGHESLSNGAVTAAALTEEGEESALTVSTMPSTFQTSAPISIEPTSAPRLTRRQREVAVLIARGYSDAQIAEAIVVTRGTASNHVTHILRRLGYRSRAQVAAWAVHNGLVPADEMGSGQTGSR